MKKIKLFICLIVAFLIGSVNCLAKEDLSMKEIIDKLPIKEDGEVKYLELPMNSFESIYDIESVTVDRDKLISEEPYYETFTDDDWKNFEDDLKFREKEMAIAFTAKLYGIDIYHADGSINLDFIDDNHIKLYYDNYSKMGEFITVELRFKVGVKDDTLKEGQTISKGIKTSYTEYGLTALNGVYHHGGVENSVFDSSLVLYRFPELKNELEKYSDYDFITLTEGAGGKPMVEGNALVVGIIKDGLLVSMKHIYVEIAPIVIVDKTLEGTIFEKAQNRLEEYFGKDSFKITKDNDGKIINELPVGETEDYFTDYLNELLNTNANYYEVYAGRIKFENGNNESIYFVEATAQEIDTFTVLSKDKKTGVMITSSSYEVAADTIVKVDNVKDKDYILTAEKNSNLKFSSAFNISLEKAFDGTLTKVITGGVEVYIPVENKAAGDEIFIYYVTEDSQVEEKIKGEVVKVEGKMYAKFMTTHFSTYAIGEDDTKKDSPDDIESTDKIDNPATVDNIYSYILLVILSSISLVYCLKLNKN